MVHLYMLAIMPPDELSGLIDLERKAFAAKYGFVAALNPPVHVTIYEPFHANEEIEGRFSTLSGIAARQVPFLLDVKDYGFFDNPSMKSPVVFIAVKEHAALRKFQKAVSKEVNRVREESAKMTSYHPHFTIGYRDVNWQVFPDIKSEYLTKKFEGSFLCDALFLWRRYGNKWLIQQKFKFDGEDNDHSVYGQLDLF